MSPPQTKLVVTDAAEARQALADLVMAWARDSATGEPRYILELDASQRGARCGCECPSCGQPLTAVNAARTEFRKRPHFRHPEGAQRDECLVLAARAAALRQLQEDGWIDLPRRRVPGQFAGLSGKFYDAWIEQPPQRIRIQDVDYRDRAAALVTLADGRQLKVELIGLPGIEDPLMPTIYIAVDDPELASMDPHELRRRARLQSTELCWHRHWNDADLLAQAEAQARAKAHFYFDDVSDEIDLPADMDPGLRRETVLHLEVKRILDEVGRLTVPEIEVVAEQPRAHRPPMRDRWLLEEETLRLSCIELETRYGRLVPDLTCEAFGDDGHARYLPLLVEVTVTNTIDDERMARIRATGEATLEIDLSRAGGRVNRDELRHLVVDEVALKRWLFHPEQARQQVALRRRLIQRVADEQLAADAHAQWIVERRELVLATPLSELAAEYVDAVMRVHEGAGDLAGLRAAREGLADAADKLAMRGYPEAGDANLVGASAILPLLLSIRQRRPIGRRFADLLGLLEDIARTTGARQSELTLYFIAAKAYPPVFSVERQAWFDAWATQVRQSIKAGEARYLRDPSYDRLLSLLFPEMAAGLAKPLGKLASGTELTWDPERQMFVRPAVPERRRAGYLRDQPRTDRESFGLLDTNPGDFWLKGRDLEAWKRANPESARDWFPYEVDGDR